MSEFVASLSDVFSLFGPIRSRKMFGGYGIYRDDLMFALVADDMLYFKVDKESMPRFQELGLAAFEYDKGDKRVQMSYRQAPEAIFDDPETAREWAQLALDAALRSRKS